MEEVVKRNMAEHDEDRIVTVLTMVSRPTPLMRRESPKSLDQPATIFDVLPK